MLYGDRLKMSEKPICGRCYDEVDVVYPANCDEDPVKRYGQTIGQYHCPDCGAMVIAGIPHPPLCQRCLTRTHPAFDILRNKCKVYIICPVRNITPEQKKEIEDYVVFLESVGYKCHFPPRDVKQDEETGSRICEEHRIAMSECDEVHVFWDVRSSGSHFDLGMAWMLGKPLRMIKSYHPDNEGKSYFKVIQSWKFGALANDKLVENEIRKLNLIGENK